MVYSVPIASRTSNKTLGCMVQTPAYVAWEFDTKGGNHNENGSISRLLASLSFYYDEEARFDQAVVCAATQVMIGNGKDASKASRDNLAANYAALFSAAQFQTDDPEWVEAVSSALSALIESRPDLLP
jgi:hypothetical protein